MLSQKPDIPTLRRRCFDVAQSTKIKTLIQSQLAIILIYISNKVRYNPPLNLKYQPFPLGKANRYFVVKLTFGNSDVAYQEPQARQFPDSTHHERSHCSSAAVTSCSPCSGQTA
jgi:hypothetical protein